VENSARKILVLVNTAASRQLALSAAVELAQQDAANLELYDCGLPTLLPLGWAGDGDMVRQYHALMQTRRLADLEALADPLRSRGLQVSTVAEPDALLEAALVLHLLESKPDLIITEEDARHDAASWQSQADGIVRRHACCPVVLVGADSCPEAVPQARSQTCEGSV